MNQHLNEQYSQDWIDSIWQKGYVIAGLSPNEYRQDKAGAWMKRDAYGDCNSGLGWEIDHIKPESQGGQTINQNLQPLNWRNNRSKGDTYPGSWKVAVTSEGNQNVWAPEGRTCL